MQTFTIYKPEIRSPHGMVAAQNRHAAMAGAAVLARGGNAMDAAVVTALVLSVVEPWLSGIGGGGFLLHADGVTGAIDALDFNVTAPRGLDTSEYPLSANKVGNWFDWPSVEDDRNVSGYSSICVPGAVAGLAEALARGLAPSAGRRLSNRRSNTRSAGWRSTGSHRCRLPSRRLHSPNSRQPRRSSSTKVGHPAPATLVHRRGDPWRPRRAC